MDTLGGSAGVSQFLALYIIRCGAVPFLSRSVHLSYFIFTSPLRPRAAGFTTFSEDKRRATE